MKALFNFLLVMFYLSVITYTVNAQWTQTNGPYGGVIQCLAVSGSNIFAGTDHSGVFLSTNNGTNWTAINTGLKNYDVQTLAVSGPNIFAGTWNGLFLSSNNGASWTEKDSGLTNKGILSIAFRGKNIFAGTSNGVFLSTNNGDSWAEEDSGLTVRVVNSLVVNGTSIFAGTGGEDFGGVYISINNGASWIPTGLAGRTVYSLIADGNNLIAGTGVGVFVSSDSGKNWSAYNPNMLNTSIFSFAVNGSNIFAGSYIKGVFLSTDSGTNWTLLDSGLTNTYVSSLAVSPNGTGGTNMFAGTNGGVFISTNNGINWSLVNTGISNTDVLCLAVNGSTLYAGTYNSGIFSSSNYGMSWTAINNSLTNSGVISSIATKGNNLDIATSYKAFLHSTNNGANWSHVKIDSIYEQVFSLAYSGTNLFAGTSYGFFVSTDNGTNWAVADSGSVMPYVSTFAVSGSNILVMSSNGYPNQIFFSTNSGVSWTETDSSLREDFNTIVFSGNNIFAGTGSNIYDTPYGNVFLSTNNGASWTETDSGLPNQPVNSLLVKGTNIFAGTGTGVFLSTDNGSSWTPENKGLTNTFIYNLAIAGNNLFAGTFNKGVWTRPLSEMITGVKDKQNNIPVNYSLSQNYPNPFNPSTIIKYQIPKEGYVVLKVYDILGNNVKTLVDGYKTQGKYSVNFNASNLSSGVYFYQLRAGNFVAAKKLLLLK